MEWTEPGGMDARGVLTLARTDLVEILSPIVMNVCADHLPLHEQRKAGSAVRAGLLGARHFLLKDPENIRDETLWRVLFSLPSYWESPVSRSGPPWPHEQLQVYRWQQASSHTRYGTRSTICTRNTFQIS
jgi:hypothetical protein